MPDELTAVKEHARELESANTARNTLFQDMENMYFMTWAEEARVKEQIKNVKLTKSPRPKNDIQGAIRLLIASDPIFSVPHDINSEQANEKANKLERFAKAMWFSAGRITGDPIHYDVVRSALLFSEIHIAITSTKDLVEWTKGAAPAVVERAKRTADTTPYLFDVWHPSLGYPEWSSLGLDAFYRKVKTTAGWVEDNWGKRAAKALKKLKADKNYSRYAPLTYNLFYDLKNSFIWLDEGEEAILQESHGLPFIPIVAQRVEGSRMFDEPENQREPFLRTLRDSKLWERENLLLTVLYTMIFAIGANPMFIYKALDPDGNPDVDYSTAGGVVKVRPGETYEPLVKNVIDPSVLQGWNIATDLGQQSTIQRQTLGEPLGGNAPYSMVALLSQAGRLPLTVPQRKTGWGIGEAIEKALRWMKHDKVAGRAYYANDQEVELLPEEVPDRLHMEANLDINLPQDRLQAANAANMLTMGDNPLVSQEWVRANILNIGQSADMTRAIWDEKAAQINFQKYVMDQMAQIARLTQAALQPGAGSGIPGGAAVPPGAPGQPSPMQPNIPPGPLPMPGEEAMPPMMANQMPME